MSSRTIWIVIIGGMLVTYALRSSFLIFLKNEQFPNWLIRGLRFTPAVVLAALISQLLVKNGGIVDISLVNPRIIAGCIAIIVAWKSRNTWLTLIVGMGILWLLTYLFQTQSI